MLIEIEYADRGGKFHAGGKSPVHGVHFGPKELTPRNLAIEIQLGTHGGSKTGKGSTAGVPPIKITKEVDKSSPNLFSMVTNNEVIPKVTINFWKVLTQGHSKQVAFKVSLTNAIVSGYFRGLKTTRFTHNIHEIEEVNFTFQKITYTNVEGGTPASDDWSAQA